ncbi:hypothetical protein [Amycolatopsis sp. lyj-23]|uniref:hypothetical protein n=1 Tax=Amycolatopsis sp. lyj-23 TaxID=2789283 RepID=UPI003979CF96
MRALTVEPEQKGSLRVDTIEDPQPTPGELLVRGPARGEYGWAPPGRDRLVLGHESLGRVPLARPADTFEASDDDVKVVIDLEGGR